MTEETAIERLDYSKPPAAYGVDRDIAATWDACRRLFDPPGVLRCGPLGLYVTFGASLPQFLSRSDAWAWYDRRLALIDDDPASRHWPRCLTWSDEQVAEVERWLADSTAEMPEALRS
jgi:hypothetical protein